MEGKYQKDISGLPELQMFRYENIFKVYETGDKNFYYYNILKKINLPENINSNFFDYLTLYKNTPLTTISYQIYGTTHLWWLIMLVNKINNPVKSLPLGKKLRYIKNSYIKDVIDNISQQLQ